MGNFLNLTRFFAIKNTLGNCSLDHLSNSIVCVAITYIYGLRWWLSTANLTVWKSCCLNPEPRVYLVIMTMHFGTAPLNIASAYRQLQPVERNFVDGFVMQVEADAAAKQERISEFLSRPIPWHMYEASNGMLDRALVRAAISERINQIAEQAELSHWRVLRELRAIAFSNIKDYMSLDHNGELVFDMSGCTPEQFAAIKKFKIKELPRGGRELEFELYDKLSGLDKFMRYMGMLDADNPYWAEEQKRLMSGKNDAAAITSDMTDDQAADAYSRMLNG
jgi:hypothetical protein